MCFSNPLHVLPLFSPYLIVQKDRLFCAHKNTYWEGYLGCLLNAFRVLPVLNSLTYFMILKYLNNFITVNFNLKIFLNQSCFWIVLAKNFDWASPFFLSSLMFFSIFSTHSLFPFFFSFLFFSFSFSFLFLFFLVTLALYCWYWWRLYR